MGFLLISPFPEDVVKATIPISFFFRKTSEIDLRKKELWLVKARDRLRVYALKLRQDDWLPIRPRCEEHRVELSVENLKYLWRVISNSSDK